MTELTDYLAAEGIRLAADNAGYGLAALGAWTALSRLWRVLTWPVRWERECRARAEALALAERERQDAELRARQEWYVRTYRLLVVRGQLKREDFADYTVRQVAAVLGEPLPPWGPRYATTFMKHLN